MSQNFLSAFFSPSSLRILTPQFKFRAIRSLVAACALAGTVTAMAASPSPSRAGFDPVAFNATFHHGVAVSNGIKLHYVEGGKDTTGDPVLLIPGWPQSWYAWQFIMPTLAAAGHHVVALDLRGMGDSDHPLEGYDSKTVASDIHAFVASLGLARNGRLHVVGHDVGAWMAYAHAADWPGDVRTLTLMEAALPGITPPAPGGIPTDDGNLRSWHFAFNRIPDLPEILVQGHERAYLSWLFGQKSAKGYVFTPDAIDEYVRAFSQPGGARAAFSYYRAAFSGSGLQQNRLRSASHLPVPVLAIGGQHSVGGGMLNTAKLVAGDVQGVTIPDTGHFVLEESPSEVSEAVLTFIQTPRPTR